MNPVPLIDLASIEHAAEANQVFGFIPLLAHQGGWDEALLVGLPLTLIGLLLWVANRRVSAQLAAAEASDSSSAADTSGAADTNATAGATSPDDAPDAR